jgi:Tol biopolymer transport system component
MKKQQYFTIISLCSKGFRILLACLIFGKAPICFSQQLPIKPARMISFTTDEGSYINVDVSSDGKTILFDLLGEVYSLPAAGGNATQLTCGLALNVRPVWSPDGKYIAYISDISGNFELHIRSVNGIHHQTLPKSFGSYSYRKDALWLPDGKYIAIDDSLYSLKGEKRPLPSLIKHLVKVTRGGQLLYYSEAGKLYQYDQITNAKTLICPLAKAPMSITLSNDIHWCAYIIDTLGERQLIVRDMIKNLKHVAVAALIEKDPRYVPDGPPSHFCFSPDSKNIFISYGGKIHRITMESGKDIIIPFTAKVRSDLGPFNYHTFRISHAPFKVRFTRSANVSPDGKHVVFSALNKLFLMDLPHGKPRILASQNVEQCQPVYSPDGKWIAYVSWCDTVGGYLWKVPAKGGTPVQLTSIAGQYQRPAWSPDSRLIAVVKGVSKLGDRDDAGSGQLELVPAEGAPIKIFNDNVPLWNELNFSADGRRVIYQPYRNKPFNALLVSKDLDGNDLQVVAEGISLPWLQQRRLSPDGRYLVYSQDENLYLLGLPKLRTLTENVGPIAKLKPIRFAEGVDPNWEKGGKILNWSYGNHFYSIDPDKILARAIKQQAATITNSPITIAIQPDQITNLNINVPQYHAHGVVILRNVRIITMKGNKVIEHGTIMIKNGRFAAVGSMKNIPVPKGAKIFDLQGKTVIPGLVDVHLHMRIPPNIFPQQSWMFLANLAYGVTTARDPSLNFDSFGYKELLESGQMLGPRLFTVGRPARIDDGMVSCNNIDDARALVHKRAELGGTVVKQYTLPNRLQRQWLLIACREAGLNMTNEGDHDPILQIGMIKDGSTGVEHNPAWGDVYKDIISFVAKSHSFLTPTLQVAYGTEEGKEYFKYKYWHQTDEKFKRFIISDLTRTGPSGNGAESQEAIFNAHPADTLNPGFLAPARIDKRLLVAGVRLPLGSHGNDEGIGPHNELWALVMGGFSNMEALRSGTIVGAEALGVQKDLGSIEVGKIADLVILNKNPLDDIHNSREIKYVMKDGILYDGDTLDTIWPYARKCPEWRLASSVH